MNKVRNALAGAALLAFTATTFAAGFFSSRPAAASDEECGECLCFDYRAWSYSTGNPICNGTSPICYNNGLDCARAGGEPDDRPGYCERRCFFQ